MSSFIEKPLFFFRYFTPRPAALLQGQKGTVVPDGDRTAAKEARPLEGFDDRRRGGILLKGLHFGIAAGSFAGRCENFFRPSSMR